MGIVDIAPWIVLAASICGLAFAMYKFFWVKKQPEGTKEMANISAKFKETVQDSWYFLYRYADNYLRNGSVWSSHMVCSVRICIRRIFLRTFRIYWNEDCYIC